MNDWMASPPRAVVFDLDGTLVDTALDIAAALDRLLVELGHRAVGVDVARGLIGGGARALVERGLAAAGAPAPGDPDALARRWLDIYEAGICENSRPYPGVDQTLTRLARAGARLAVCTNKADRSALRLLDALGLSGHFTAIVGGDVPRRKPDPAHLRAALGRIGAREDEAVLVGDSDTDAATARDAGVAFIAVSYGYGPLAARSRARVIADFATLPDVLGFR